MAFWLRLLLAILASSLALGLIGVIFGNYGIAFVAIVMSLAAAVFLVTSVWAAMSGAPYVPISHEHAAQVLEAADLRPGELLIDLGSGDGRLLLAAAARGGRAQGWEINPYLWLLSLYHSHRLGRVQAVSSRLGSYWDKSVAEADVVTLFLITYRMAKMSRKLWAELRPGARVVSYGFQLPDWPGEIEVYPNVYLYHRP